MYKLFLRSQLCEDELLMERDDEDKQILYRDSASVTESQPSAYDEENAARYLEENVFSILFSALEDTLVQVHKAGALHTQKCRFNGVDNVAEILWNRNPRRMETLPTWIPVFEIPPFRDYLRSHPRPFYPKSWLWSPEEAALRIQKCVRGWLVRKRDDVYEMREFWKKTSQRRSVSRMRECQNRNCKCSRGTKTASA